MNALSIESLSAQNLSEIQYKCRHKREKPYWILDTKELSEWSKYYKKELGLERYWEALEHCLRHSFWTDKK